MLRNITNLSNKNNLLFRSRPLLNKLLANRNESYVIRTSTLAKLICCSVDSAHNIVKKWVKKGWALISKVAHGYLIVIHRPTVKQFTTLIKPLNNYNKKQLIKKALRCNNALLMWTELAKAGEKDSKLHDWAVQITSGRAKYYPQFKQVISGLQFFRLQGGRDKYVSDLATKFGQILQRISEKFT